MTWWRKSKGHITWSGSEELIEATGAVWRAPRNKCHDPEGYRHGMTSDCWTRSITPAQAREEVNNFIAQHPEFTRYFTTGRKRDKPQPVKRAS